MLSFRLPFCPSFRASVCRSARPSFRSPVCPSFLSSVLSSVVPSIRPSVLPSFLSSVFSSFRPSVLQYSDLTSSKELMSGAGCISRSWHEHWTPYIIYLFIYLKTKMFIIIIIHSNICENIKTCVGFFFDSDLFSLIKSTLNPNKSCHSHI